MSDRTPDDGRDDDGVDEVAIDEVADLARLDRLGLAALADGPAPGGAGLADVRARARRLHRRRWVPAVAAVVVLVLSVGAALALVRGDEGGVSVDTPGGEEQFLLPPADARDVGYWLALNAVYADPLEAASEYQRISFYVFQFVTPDGENVRLTVGRAASPPGTGPQQGIVGATDLGTLLGVPSAFPQVEVSEGVVRALVTCAGVGPSGEAPVGPVGARGAVGSWTFLLSTGPEGDGTTPCELTPAATSAVTELVRSLRVVDTTTWGRYLGDHAATNTLDASGSAGTTPAAPTGG